MKEFNVPEETLIGVLKYLHTRPYQEVVGLIQTVQQAKEIKEGDLDGS